MSSFGESLRSRRRKFGKHHHHNHCPTGGIAAAASKQEEEEDVGVVVRDSLGTLQVAQGGMERSVNQVTTPKHENRVIPRKRRKPDSSLLNCMEKQQQQRRTNYKGDILGKLPYNHATTTTRNAVASSASRRGEQTDANKSRRITENRAAAATVKNNNNSTTRFKAPENSDDDDKNSGSPVEIMEPKPKHAGKKRLWKHKKGHKIVMDSDSDDASMDDCFLQSKTKPVVHFGTPSDTPPQSSSSSSSCFASVPATCGNDFGRKSTSSIRSNVSLQLSKANGRLQLSKANGKRTRLNKATKIEIGRSLQKTRQQQQDPIVDSDDDHDKRRGGRRKSSGVSASSFHCKEQEPTFLQTNVTKYKSRPDNAAPWITKTPASQKKRSTRKGTKKNAWNDVVKDIGWRAGNYDDEEYTPVSAPRRQTRSSTSNQKKKRPVPEGPIDLCSDSESEVVSVVAETPSPALRRSMRRTPSPPLCLNVVRMAFGKKVVASKCRVRYEPQQQRGSSCAKLTLEYQSQQGGRKHQETRESFVIQISEDMEELKYHLVGDDANNNSKETQNSSSFFFDESEQMTFLSMRVTPNEDNGLSLLSNKYAQSLHNQTHVSKKYIVIEFRSDQDLVTLLERFRHVPAMLPYASEESRLMDACFIPQYAASLLEESKQEKKRRESSMGSPQTRSAVGRRRGRTNVDANEIMLVYPFGVSLQVMDQAAGELTVAHGNSQPAATTARVKKDENKIGPTPMAVENNLAQTTSSSSGDDDDDSDDADTNGDQKQKGRTHALTIRREDRDRLAQDEFLNDTLIDFWMQWMWRKEKHNPTGDSDVHIFTSHFYTTLKEEGPAAVTSWTAKKGIDVFAKKFVFIPINKSLHWSLCVVVNPGAILHACQQGANVLSPQTLCSSILFFDSLKAHSKVAVANAVRKWLNAEWTRLGHDAVRNGPFSKKTMPVYDPVVPYQDNSWDCGVFVCRYAYGMYCLRHEDFTVEDSMEMSPFSKIISQAHEFDFGMDDIRIFREEFGVLIDRLATAYKPWKQAQDEQEKKAKAEKKKGRKVQEAEKSKENAKPPAPPVIEGKQDEESEGKRGASPAHEIPTDRALASGSDQPHREIFV